MRMPNFGVRSSERFEGAKHSEASFKLTKLGDSYD
jgi:hypothetical protein